MIIVNTTGLHPVLYTALSSSYMKNQENRNQERKDWSVTELLLPPKISILTKRHKDELEIDAINLIDVSFGTILHSLIETSYKHLDLPNIYLETKVKTVFQDKIISGRVDFYDLEKKEIIDFKYYKTNSWLFIDDKIEELTWQLNMYKWLMELNGFPVDKLTILFIFKDYNSYTAKRDQHYPNSVWQELEIECKSRDEIEAYVENKLNILNEYEKLADDLIPNCSYEDRWQNPDSYNVFSEGKKIASFPTLEEAETFKNNNSINTYEIHLSKYSPKRCDKYCAVKDYCFFYTKLTKDEQDE